MRMNWLVKGAGMLACGLAMLAVTVGPAGAADDKVLEQLKARLDALEQQNKDLQEKVKTAGPYHPVYQDTPALKDIRETERVNKQVDDYLKDKDSKKKAEDDAKAKQREDDGYVIGSDLKLNARWNYQQGLLFETENKDIRSHVGFFFQADGNYFSQSPQLRPTATQLGDFQDGAFFRRIRPLWDGTAYDTFEWNIILALEQISNNGNNANGLINLDEMWVGVYNLPVLGHVRVGHLKVAQGLEGNQFSSSRAMTFQENSAYTDAFYTIFGTGVQILNSALDDRITWQGMIYRDDFSRGNTGAQFGDGTYCGTGRFTALLIDEDKERHLLHVGLSGTWRKATTQDNTGNAANPEGGLTGPNLIRLRARPELRDAIGGYGDNNLPGTAGRLVDTGNITASSTGVVGTELLYILGPLSFQAEWAVDYINNAVTGTGKNQVNKTRSFNGGYGMVSYFLTGENRSYDKPLGRLGTFYIDRPFTNFWLQRDENGGFTFGPGAWEVAARYSYLNLNDGPIQGGVLSCGTIGLNWYLSSNLKVQFEYNDNLRYHKSSGANGNAPGYVDGFGTRVQMQF